MGFLSMGKRPKPKPFGFIPRYYDEAKEEREMRLKQLQNPDDIDAAQQRIRSGLRQSYRGDAQLRKELTRKSNIRLLYIIIALILVTVAFLNSEVITQFIDKIYK